MNHSSMNQDAESIVISGTGLITSLGLDREQTWQGICAGLCGIRSLTAIEQGLNPDKGGGQAPDPPEDDTADLPREVRYLRMAIRQALQDARALDQPPYPDQRCGIILGTTLHGIRAAGRYFRDQSLDHFTDFLAPAILGQAVEGIGLNGLATTTCTACSSGLSSIGLGMTMLQRGELDLVVTGGYDVISEYAYAGFNSLRLIAEDRPRPFCQDREGMKLGEGYGVLILERRTDALDRGVSVLATIAGIGEAADAFHLSQPHPEGDGAIRAVSMALADAQLDVDQINLITAHATGTPDNDKSEFAALSHVFGAALPDVPVVALKSNLGHTLGGAGAVELILSICAMRDGLIPATPRIQASDLEYEGLNLNLGETRSAEIHHTLNLSIGFGGINTCLILNRPPMPDSEHATSSEPRSAPQRAATSRDDEVVVTGVGMLAPGAIGNDAFGALLGRDSGHLITADTGLIPDEALQDLLNARRVRRMSDYVKLCLAATTLAWRDAQIEDSEAFAATCYGILGTSHGSAIYSNEFYEQIVRDGINGANPLLFAESVPNSGAAHIGLMLSIKNGCQTLIGSRTTGLEALRLAAARIASGRWSRAIVSTADEDSPLVRKAYGNCGLYNVNGPSGSAFNGELGFRCGSGGASLMLESRRSAEARGARIRGIIEAVSTSFAGSSDPRGMVRSARDVLSATGNPEFVISSANGTWLDRIESTALRASFKSTPITVSTLYGHIAECFSVMPIAGLAAVLMNRQLPRFPGDATNLVDSLRPADGSECPTAFGVLATDFQGLLAGARIRLE